MTFIFYCVHPFSIINIHYICNHKNLSLKNEISAFKGFTVMGSRYSNSLFCLRQLINEKGRFQLSESQIPFQLPYSILPLGIYSFASRFVYIYFVLVQLSDRPQSAMSATQSERSAFFGLRKVAGGPPSFLSPPTDLCTKGNVEVEPVSILSDTQTPLKRCFRCN